MISTHTRAVKRKSNRTRRPRNPRKSRKSRLYDPAKTILRANQNSERIHLQLLSDQEELRAIQSDAQSRLDALTSRHALLRNTLNHEDAPMLMLSRELCIRFANAAAMAAFDLPADAGNLRLSDTVLAGMERIIAHVIASQQELRRDVRLPGSQGRWYSLHIRPTADGAVLHGSDIDALRQARDGECAGREAAHETCAANDALITSLATELQAPVDNLRACCALLRSIGLNTEDDRRLLESMAHHAKAQYQRIDALLETSAGDGSPAETALCTP